MRIDFNKIKRTLFWLARLVVAFFVFMILYGVSQVIVDVAESPLMKILASILTAGVLIGSYGGLRYFLEKKWPDDLNWKRLLPDTVLGMGMGVAYFCALVLLMLLFGLYKVQSVQFPAVSLAVMFANFLMVAVGEEIVFRGVFFRMIDYFIGTKTAYLLSALLFGFAHLPQGTVWSSVAIAIEAGLLLAVAYKYTNTLWLPIGIHWTWNFTQGNVFGFMVSGTDSGNSIITSLTEGPELLTGGEFGAEASILAVVLGAALAVYLIYSSNHLRLKQ